MRSTFAVRGFFERGVRALEDRARVHQRAIENQLEEIVAEIVVRRDIALAAGPGVAIEIVNEAADGIGEPREAAVDALGDVAIANHDLHERSQIVSRPRARHVSLGRAHAAREREVGIEPMIVDADSRAQIGVGQILAACDALVAIFDHDSPIFDSRQPAQHRSARETIKDRWPTRPRRIDPRRDYGIRLAHLDASNTRGRVMAQAERRKRH